MEQIEIIALSDWHGSIIHKGQKVGYLYKTQDGYKIEINYREYHIKRRYKKHLKEYIQAILLSEERDFIAELKAKARGFKILY